jgi:ADP-heptose:LPS heptosyltransferase
LLELSEVFRRSELVLSLDSGSTHLAWATGKPKIVTIFCCTPVGKYAPIGNSDKYVALSGHLPCQPCHKRRCPLDRGQNSCTLAPSVEEVLEAVHKLLPVGNKS